MDSSFWLITTAIFAPLILGCLTLWLPRRLIPIRLAIAAAGPLLSVICLLSASAGGGIIDSTNVEALNDHINAGEATWIEYVHLNFSFLNDGMGTFFALLVSGIGLLIVLYARGYFGKDADSLYRFYPTLGFFTTAMIGIVLSDNMLLTMMFWELTSISSFLLIGWDRDDKHAVKLAMQAFFTTGMGGMAMFGGILMFGQVTGTMGLGPEGEGIWRWSVLLAQDSTALKQLADNGWIIASFCLMFAGAATKSAQYPFHYWLPGAMAAPTPVSAFLHSATMVKAGVFLVGRLFPVFGASIVGHDTRFGLELWPYLIVPLGAGTMLYGGIVAINQFDLKKIFAYTTVSQLGLLMCMYGLGAFEYVHDGHHALAIDFDITQIANHAFYKAPLFITAGAIGHYLSRNITELNGAFQKHKWICITMILAAYGLAAGPGTISFQAKELFLYAIYHAAEEHPWLWIIMAMTVLTAICNVAIFIRLTTTLLGLKGGMQPLPGEHHDDHHHHEHEHGFMAHLIWIPGLVIVSLQYIGGIATPVWNSMFHSLETNINYEGFHGHVPALWQIHFGTPLIMSVIAIAGGIALGYSKLFRGHVNDPNDRIYPALYRLFVEGGGKAFRVLQTGHLRHYVTFTLVAFVIGMLGAFWMEWQDETKVWNLPTDKILEFWPGIFIGFITCATALLLPLVQQRVVRVLILGSCGFSVVGLYLIYQAPDLALTQLMFEIISVILFVLVLRLLPEPVKGKPRYRPRRALIGVATGLVVGFMTLVAAPTDGYDDKAGMFYVNSSYDGRMMVDELPVADGRGGGGNNIVNVILVDFRGFDTLGEITVLGIAALGVWSLLPGRNRHNKSAEAV